MYDGLDYTRDIQLDGMKINTKRNLKKFKYRVVEWLQVAVQCPHTKNSLKKFGYKAVEWIQVAVQCLHFYARFYNTDLNKLTAALYFPSSTLQVQVLLFETVKF